MPKLPPYSWKGPIDHKILPDRAQLLGKSVVITGGANGIGQELVRQFAAAGSFVTYGDTNETRGDELEAELNRDTKQVRFVRCDITKWEDQIRMFDAATNSSPRKSCDIVIANAGISRSSGDSLVKLDDVHEPPIKPELNIVNVNIIGTLYTFKLAAYYFRKQPDTVDRDRCFIITGSVTTYIDSPLNWEYTCSKYALRGLMKTVRRSSWEQGIRINYVAPCYIRSSIRTAEYQRGLEDKGVSFGYPEDVARCMMRIAADRTMNGHSLLIVPRSVAKEGFVDAEVDDWTEDGYMKSMQEVQLRIIEDKWVEQ